MACPTLHTPTSAVPSVASIWPWALFSLISGLLGPSGITTASKCVFPVGHEKAERFLNTLFSQGLTTESGWACGKIEAVDPRILATSKLSSPSLHIPHFVDQRGRDAQEDGVAGVADSPSWLWGGIIGLLLATPQPPDGVSKGEEDSARF